MGAFSTDGRSRVGLWDACLSAGDGVAWLTVSLGRDNLFRVEVRGSRVKATYALPAVMERGDGEKEQGTAWGNSRRWNVNGWSDVPEISAGIRKFFDNTDEFLAEERRVHEILNGSNG